MSQIEQLERVALAALAAGYSLHVYMRLGPIPALALVLAAAIVVVLPRRLVRRPRHDGPAAELPPALAALGTLVVLVVFVVPLNLAGGAGALTSVLLAGSMLGMGYGLPALWHALRDHRALAPALLAAFGGALALAAPDVAIAVGGGVIALGAINAGLLLR